MVFGSVCLTTLICILHSPEHETHFAKTLRDCRWGVSKSAKYWLSEVTMKASSGFCAVWKMFLNPKCDGVEFTSPFQGQTQQEMMNMLKQTIPSKQSGEMSFLLMSLLLFRQTTESLLSQRPSSNKSLTISLTQHPQNLPSYQLIWIRFPILLSRSTMLQKS